MFQSVLAALKPSASQQFINEHAVGLAKRLGAELAVTTVIDEEQIAPPEPVPLGAGAIKREHDAELIAAARTEAAQLLERCRAAAAAAGVKFAGRQVEGRVVDALARETHEHDLLLIGRDPADDTSDASLPYRILKHAPRPAMVYPKQAATGEAVVVAYDGSVQAARTLASFAYSGLGVGRTVHVACYQDDADRAAELCESACRFLRRHHLFVESHAAKPVGSIASSLTNLAMERAAGLLVMGAFSRSAVRELFFGSTTKSILRECPLPVFVDH